MSFMRCGATMLICLCAIGQVSAQTYKVIGAGEKSCGDFSLAKDGKSSEPALPYAAIVGWIDGYLTGYAAESTASSFVWDVYVRGTDLTPVGVISARQQYCRQLLADDPICTFWNPSNLARAADIDPVLRDISLNERLAWIARECAALPLERIKDAAARLYMELVAPRRRDASSNPGALVGAVYHTNFTDTTALLTQTTNSLRLQLFGGSQADVDLRLVGADWIGGTEKSPHCAGGAGWRFHQVEQTLLLEETCAGSNNGARGVTFVLSKD